MSYILDALRKSEQQRQATQPETVTERILVNSSQTAPKSSWWLIILVAINLIAICMMAWMFFHKNQAETVHNAVVSSHPVADRTVREKTGSSLVSSIADESENKVKPKSSSALNDGSGSSEPSIAQMLDEKMTSVKPVEVQRKFPLTANKKPVALKKEKKPADFDQDNLQNKSHDFISNEKPVLPTKELASLAKDSDSDSRLVSPKLNINVFSYAEKPEDRFVIIDMVKYKIGQHINGDVKLKEIRSDSIVLQDEKGTFTVDRP